MKSAVERKAFKEHYVFSEITSIVGSARLRRTLHAKYVESDVRMYGGNRYHRLADLFDHARIYAVMLYKQGVATCFTDETGPFIPSDLK